MCDTLRLTMLTGPHKGTRYCYRGPLPCVLGRGNDCTVQFAGDPRDESTSRRHCQLLLDPPCIRLQDLGSLNGTYLNGHMLEWDSAAAARLCLYPAPPPPAEVESGDIITIGANSFRVEMVACPPNPGPAVEPAPVWAEGEMIKKDCPINC
jgi:hypothetical protein